MPQVTEWKHRTKVYKFGTVWFWKCQQRPDCAGGRRHKWIWALGAALEHTRGHGCYVYDNPD